LSFFIKTSGPEDWKAKLADPKHWKKGCSAKTLAYSWMEAKGFPKSVKEAFQKSDYPIFNNIKFLFGIVEHKVPLSGGRAPSQSDIFVLGRSKKDLVSITVEGKVSESFDETVRDWLIGASKGKMTRLKYLSDLLQLDQENLQEIRYQLLHRTASAIIEAKRFNASSALMLVHSFSQNHEWFDDYSRFAKLLGGITAQMNTVHFTKRIDNIDLYLAWVTGEEKYLSIE